MSLEAIYDDFKDLECFLSVFKEIIDSFYHS